MIIIKREYLDKFYKSGKDYLYPVSKGIYLCFDGDTLAYKDVIYYYLPFDYKSYQKDSDDLLNRLITKGILEVLYD